MIKKIVVGSVLASSLVFASNNSAQININNNTLEVAGDIFLNDSYNLNDDSNYFLTARYLTSDEGNSKVSSQKLLTTGFKIVNPYIDDKGFSLGMGIDAVWADNYSKTFYAVALKISGKYMINEQLSTDLEIGYSPKVITYGDGDNFKSGQIKLNYKIIDNGYIYVGARSITTNYKDGTDVDFDSSAFFGYKVTF